jgi:hypothetical protein
VFRRLAAMILSCCALIALSGSSASATSPPRPGSEWREVLTLSAGHTSGEAKIPLRADECAAALKAVAGRSATDCVTHYRLTVTKPARTAARNDGLVLADYNCNVSAEAQMWNFFWWADATVYFCFSPSYIYAYSVDCSNWGSGPYQSLNITWCAPGAQGSRADGGENVSITGPYGNYGAGQRASLDIYGRYTVFCWNAHC